MRPVIGRSICHCCLGGTLSAAEFVKEKQLTIFATKLSSEDTEQIQGVEYDTVGQYYERLFRCHL